MSSMIEDFGDQTFLLPLRNLLGDARGVMEENLRRIEAAERALSGDYPGAGAVRHLNGHQQALPPAPVAREHPPKPGGMNGSTSVQEWVEAAMRVADEVGLIGVFGTPGIMQSVDVVDLLATWGWRKNVYANPTQTVSSSLCTLMKLGVLERVNRGSYRMKPAVAEPVPVEVTPPPVKVTPPPVVVSSVLAPPKTADRILSVMRGMHSQQVRSIDILEGMVKTGWTSNSKDPLAVVNTTLSQLVRKHPNVSRPRPARYMYS